MDECCCGLGIEETSFRVELEREGGELFAGFAAEGVQKVIELEVRVFLLLVEVGLAVRASVGSDLTVIGKIPGTVAVVAPGDLDM